MPSSAGSTMQPRGVDTPLFLQSRIAMRNIPLTNRLLRADFDTVMEKYHFHDRMVSFNKNFEFEPPLDTITYIIAINDDEDSHCASYRAIFDYDMNIIDDVLSR